MFPKVLCVFFTILCVAYELVAAGLCSKYLTDHTNCLENVAISEAYRALNQKRSEARDLCYQKNQAWKNCYFQVVKGDTCLENLSNLTHTEGSSLAKAKTAWLIAHEDCFAKPHNVDPLFVLFGTSNTISGSLAGVQNVQKSAVFGRLKKRSANLTESEISPSVEVGQQLTPQATTANSQTATAGANLAYLTAINGILNNPCKEFETCVADQQTGLSQNENIREQSKKVYSDTQKCNTANQTPYECTASTNTLAECVTAAAYAYQSHVISTLLSCIQT